jgi:hypothetical protein
MEAGLQLPTSINNKQTAKCDQNATGFSVQVKAG